MTALSVRYFILVLKFRTWHRVWNISSAIPIIEEEHNYIIVGDAGYGLSEVWTKPFSEAELNYEVARLRRNLIYNN